MADEPTDITQDILRKIQDGIAKLQERAEKSDATIARIHADTSRNIGKMHADILSMHTDVVEAKAVSREVAVRLTLIEKRTADMDGKIDTIREDVDAIKKHVGLVQA